MLKEQLLVNYELTETKDRTNQPMVILTFDINDLEQSLSWEPIKVEYDNAKISVTMKDSDDTQILLKTEASSYNQDIYEKLNQYDIITVAGLNRLKKGNPVEYAYLVDNINTAPKLSKKIGF